MGYSLYDTTSHAAISSRNVLRSTGAVASMAYTTDIQEGRTAAQVHAQMDPRGVTRESRDSTAHPASVPIAVFFDHTGSMKEIPRLLQQRLQNLMSMLALRNYITDPQVLFGSIGDATCDPGPIQVGQFESSAEMDDDLDRLWLVGRGGSQHHESYELAHYFMARHTITDAWEKRTRKGYLFTIGDEAFYPTIEPRRVQEVFGDTLVEPVQARQIVEELQTRWHVFHFHAEEGSYPGNAYGIRHAWEELLGAEHVLSLKHSEHAGEMVGLVIGLTEGTVDGTQARQDLIQLGLDASQAQELVESLGGVAARGIRIREEAMA